MVDAPGHMRRVARLLAALWVCAAACGVRSRAPERRECLSSAELARVAARANSPTEEQAMKKLDLSLQHRVKAMEDAARQQARRAGPTSAATPAAAPVPCIEPHVEVTVWFTGNADDLIAAGLELGWRDRNDRGLWFATGQIAPSRLTELAAIEHVVSVHETKQATPELSDSVRAIRVQDLRAAHSEVTGTGVVVAIFDAGFDWTHGSFRDNTTGRTRLLAIWDFMIGRLPSEVGFQARDPNDPTKRLPALGVYYDRDDIDFSLGYPVTKTNPVKVRTTDPPKPSEPNQPDRQSGHGTHVGGIAAGDGSPLPCCQPWSAGQYKGVAPRADIIVVRGSPNDGLLPRALSFIDEIAGTKPVVVNISAGQNEGPHDGTTIAEKAIDRFMTKPGRVVVKSAGNEGNTKKHGRVTVPAQQAGPPPAPGLAELDVVIPAEMKARDELQLWYSQQESLELQLAVEGGPVSNWLAQQGSITLDANTLSPPTRLEARATPSAAENGDRKVDLSVTEHKSTSALTVKLRFRNAGARPVVVDGWISKGTRGLTFADPTVEGTLTTPGTALSAIVVANHTLGSSGCDSGSAIHESSSRGPVRVAPADPDAAKPTLAAPGTGITSAKPDGDCCCCPEWLESHYQSLSGTSMSAPHVAGAIALMLQKNPALTATQVRDLLKDNVTKVNGPANEWGAGKLDVLRAWEAVPAPATPASLAARASSGAATLAAPAPAPVPLSVMHPALRVLRETVRGLPDGELCAALVSRHFSEVRRLVNSNLKVAAMWHRADGPRMLRRLAVGTVEAGAPAPLRGDGDRAYLMRMLKQLHRYGSPALRASIERHQALLLSMLEVPLAARLATA